MKTERHRCTRCRGGKRTHAVIGIVTLETGEQCHQLQCRTCGTRSKDIAGRWVPPGLKYSPNRGVLKQLTLWE